MDYQQQMAAIKALAPEAVVVFYGRDNWGVRVPRVEIKNGAILGSVYATGQTPAAAIEATWEALTTELTPGSYLVREAMDPKRRMAVRWNGFMWDVIDEPAPVGA